jgi:DNA-binding GntR family transcriptional regulator
MATKLTNKAEKSRIKQYSDPVAIVVEHIDKLLGSGRLVAGQRLVESDLAQELGVGRGPIREALRILAGDGVVELMPNRGARIRSFTNQQSAEMLRALVALLGAGIEEFVTSPNHAEGVRQLQGLVDEFSARATELGGVGLLEMMAMYEQTIFEFAGNSYLIELHRRVHFHHYNRQIADVLGFQHLLKLVDVYKKATRALRKKDAETASKLFKAAVMDMVRSLEAAEADEIVGGNHRKAGATPSRQWQPTSKRGASQKAR